MGIRYYATATGQFDEYVSATLTLLCKSDGRKCLRNTKISLRKQTAGLNAYQQLLEFVDFLDSHSLGCIAYGRISLGGYVQDQVVNDVGGSFKTGLMVFVDPSNMGLKQYVTIPFLRSAEATRDKLQEWGLAILSTWRLARAIVPHDVADPVTYIEQTNLVGRKIVDMGGDFSETPSDQDLDDAGVDGMGGSAT